MINDMPGHLNISETFSKSRRNVIIASYLSIVFSIASTNRHLSIPNIISSFPIQSSIGIPSGIVAIGLFINLILSLYNFRHQLYLTEFSNKSFIWLTQKNTIFESIEMIKSKISNLDAMIDLDVLNVIQNSDFIANFDSILIESKKVNKQLSREEFIYLIRNMDSSLRTENRIYTYEDVSEFSFNVYNDEFGNNVLPYLSRLSEMISQLDGYLISGKGRMKLYESQLNNIKITLDDIYRSISKFHDSIGSRDRKFFSFYEIHIPYLVTTFAILCLIADIYSHYYRFGIDAFV